MKNLTLRFILSVIALWACIWSCMAFQGCARIQVGDASYTRLGNQNLDIELFMSNGTKVVIKQNSKTEIAKELLNTAGELLK